ncbi:MAG: protein kinase [Alistipes sp.]|nr:protein kinase [Alistipes sp.]
MTTIANIVDALAAPYTVWRTLRGIEPTFHDNRPLYVAGNAAVTFRVKHDGMDKILKCYTRTNNHLAAIYGDEFHPRELCIIDIVGRKVWIDCLLTPYIEGITLDEALCSADGEQELIAIASSFDTFAKRLLLSERAHGDLKPENLILTPTGEIRAIDWDAAFLPSFAGEASPEIGTAAYQHPQRTTDLYDKHIDDYSIAFLSVFLHAAAIDSTTIEYFRKYHEPMLSPKDIIRGKVSELERICDLFAQRGMAREYRLAQMLRSTSARLFNLRPTLLPEITLSADTSSEDNDNAPCLDVANGYWGCRDNCRWLIEPLFDNGYEPTCGVMLTELGGYSHFVDLEGNVVKSFSMGTRVKPMRDGTTTAYYPNGVQEHIKTEDLLQILDK